MVLLNFSEISAILCNVLKKINTEETLVKYCVPIVGMCDSTMFYVFHVVLSFHEAVTFVTFFNVQM